MAFINYGNRFQVAQSLNQGGFVGVRQQHIIVLEIVCKEFQITVLLINLANILLFAVHTQRSIAQHANRQHFFHGIGREVLTVQELLLCIYANLARKISVYPLSVCVINIG